MAAPAAFAIRIAGDLAEFRKNLDEAKAQVETTKKAMQAMANGLDGSRVIANANAMAKAISDIGGVTALTDSEQKRVNAAVTEAIAKYQALGKEAPNALFALQAQTSQLVQTAEQLPPSLDKSSGFFGKLTTEVKSTALGFISAQAVIGVAQQGFHALSDFVAGSVESYASAEAAAKKMTVALQQQGTATPENVSAMNDLATSVQRTTVYSDDLTNQMEALLVEVGNVAPSEMRKALQASTDLASGLGIDLQQATMLVGKAFAGETGTLSRYGIVIDQTKLKAEGMPAVLEAIQQKFGGQAAAELETYSGKLKQIANDWDNIKEAVGKNIVEDPLLRALLRETAAEVKTQSEAVDAGSGSWSSWIDTLNGFVSPSHKVTQELRDQAEIANTLADAMTRMNSVATPAIFGGTDSKSQFAEHDRQAKALADSIQEGWQKDAAAAEEYSRKVDAAFKRFSGADVAEQAKILDATFRRLADSGQLTQRQLQDIVTEAVKLGNAGATLSPRLWDVVLATGALNPKVTEGAEAFASLGDKIALTIPQLSAFAQASDALQSKMKDGWQGVTDTMFKAGDSLEASAKQLYQKATDSAKQFGADLGNVIIGAIQGGGNILNSAGGFVGKGLGTALATHLSTSLVQDGAGMLSKAFGGLLNAVLPGIGSLMGPLLSKAWDGLKSLFGANNSGRDMVTDFIAQNFGSASEMQKQLLELGPEYDHLWRGITQLGNNASTSEAKAAIDAVTAALAAHKQKVQEDAAATEQAAQQVTAAQQAAKDAAQKQLDGLDQQIKSLQDSIANEAPEEVMGIVEAQTRAQIDALKAQRDEAAKTMEALNQNTADSLKDVANAIKNLPDEIKIRVQLDYEGGGRDSVPAHGTGGFFQTPHLAVIGDAPEYITPRQSIPALAREVVAAMGGGGARSAGGSRVPVNINVDGRQWISTFIDVSQAWGTI
jgi:hypothetical protein